MIKKLFFLILFLFALGEIFRFDLGSGFFLKPIDIGVGIVTVLWLISKLAKRKGIKPKNVFIPTLLFAGSGLFSLLINIPNLSMNQFFASLMYLVRWIAYACIFFVAFDFNKDFKKKIPDLLIILGSVIVGLGYLQYIFYSNLKNLYYLGWDEHMYRMFSVFLDPNFAGAFFVLFFLFLMNIFFKRRSILIGTLSALTLGAIFLTFSRSALIMLIASASIMFTLLNKKIFIVLLVLITLAVLAISSRYFNIENINLFRIVSSEARLETAGNALTIFNYNPLFGVGFNAYRYAQIRYGLRNNDAQILSHADAGADNSILFVVATTGIFGLILYLFLWLKLIRSVPALGVASIIGAFVNSMFINSLFYPFIMLWLWIILALSIKNHN